MNRYLFKRQADSVWLLRQGFSKNKFLLSGVAAAAMLAAATPASASHIFFSNVKIDGVALNSVAGQTNPLFTVNKGGTLQFTVDGDGAGGDVINVSITGIDGLDPTAFQFAFSGGDASFAKTLTFNEVGPFSGRVFLDIPSSFPDYRAPDGNTNADGQSFAFRVNVLAVNSAVPEPATWAMMLMGFGAVGYSMRSRKVGYKAPQAA